jgi:uroporphyrinogen decarboxylase
MNSQQRFLETMAYGRPDRPPCFEEGIRDDVLRAWCEQGMPAGKSVYELFDIDRREEIMLEVEPRPYPKEWPTSAAGLDELRRRLDPDDERRLPAGWPGVIDAWQQRDYPLLIRVHDGFFQTLGIGDWRRFEEVIYLTKDDPAFVQAVMDLQGQFVARLLARILARVDVDGAIFSEPIAGISGPLISPKMYEQFALASYEPILAVLRQYGVKTIIARTYANTRILIPSFLKWGFNCLWACETGNTMDYLAIRREYGPELRLIGGIDTDALRGDKESIRREVEEKVPALLAQGGYLPLADGRVRVGISYENYAYYRTLLAEVIALAGVAKWPNG